MRCALLVLSLAACTRASPSVTLAPPPPASTTPASVSSLVPPPDAGMAAAFFPPGTFPAATQKLVSDWYGKHLRAMAEPSLWAAAVAGKTSIRFLWLRTWGRPIAVRVERAGRRTHLVATRLTGNGGYDPGKIDTHRERDLTPAEWQRVVDALAAAHFDTTPTEGEMGDDGAQWILERAQAGSYRLVERWSPTLTRKDAAFASACNVLLDLAGRDLVTGHVY
jgi:hypothetical protein